MKKEYDFSKARRNPYAKKLKRPVTIRLDEQTIDYFKDLAEETGIPYQTLINWAESLFELEAPIKKRCCIKQMKLPNAGGTIGLFAC